MKPMIIRSIDDAHFPKLKQHFDFLVKRIHQEHGELDLRLRNNYFNLYYKGNSMAKVRVQDECYEVSTNRKFISASDGKPPDEETYYKVTSVLPKNLKTHFSKQALDRIAARIKKVNWGEEVTFEQMLITDNPPNPEFIIIDRQVTGGALGRIRLDLLALRLVSAQDNSYRFVILEVKLGRNPDLAGKVLKQLRGYMKRISDQLLDFAECYQRTYWQMRAMGLFNNTSMPEGMPETIKIVGPVEGMIVVGGYSGVAGVAMKELNQLVSALPDEMDRFISIWQAKNNLTQRSTLLIPGERCSL